MGSSFLKQARAVACLPSRDVVVLLCNCNKCNFNSAGALVNATDLAMLSSWLIVLWPDKVA